jgi:hypothetical protein
VKALALALALTLGACASAPSVPTPKDARAVLAQAIEYGQDAAAATKAVCTFSPTGEACEYLIKVLDTLFEKAVEIEAALNAGEDMSEEVADLERALKVVLDQARAIVKRLV